MRRIVEFWIGHGVTHVPRRQPAHQAGAVLGVADPRGADARIPDVVFLAEAFTRPKMMKVLAKAGFTQSYTYFTWRNDEGRARRSTSTEITHAAGRRVLPRQPLAEHAGHPARDAAARRAARLQAAAGAGGHAVVALRHLQRLRARRERAVRAGLRGVPELGEVRAEGARLERARQPRRLHHADQPHPPRASARCSSTATSRSTAPTTRTSSGTAR